MKMSRALPFVLLSTACGKAPPPAPPPVDVVVTTVSSRDVPVMAEFTGEIRGAEDVQVMARVAGFLQEQAYREGELVHKGDLLFLIDPKEYQAAEAAASAEVARSEALLAKATVQANRLRPLAAQNAVSRQDLDNAEANEAASKATLDAARAQLDKARLDLGYTRVTSPLDGVAGLRQIDLGTYVGAPQPTVLTVVSKIDPLRFDFGIAESEYLALAGDSAATAARAAGRAPGKGIALQLVLADGSVFPEAGRITVVGRGVDPTTGTLPIQAEFPNPNGLLRPGQFARIRVPLRLEKDAVVVPQRAIQELQGTYNVAVVKSDNAIEMRVVKVAHRVGDEWVVSGGLAAGERIVVEGLQKVRQGTVVRPAEAGAAPSDTAKAR